MLPKHYGFLSRMSLFLKLVLITDIYRYEDNILYVGTHILRIEVDAYRVNLEMWIIVGTHNMHVIASYTDPAFIRLDSLCPKFLRKH